jgi:hypothetical protein
MTRKHWTLIALVIGLAALSFYLNKDWFAGENIHIYHRSRPARAGMFRGRQRKDDNPAVNPILFGFGRKLKLTSIKVVPEAEYETNKHAHAIWHLVSETNSVPIKDFNYGQPISGMHPEVKGASPEPLEPGVKYRLFVETAKLKAEHDFTPDPRTPE